MKVRSLWELPWAFAPLFILALIGLYRLYKLKRARLDSLMVWFIVPLIAMCLPVFFRMRMSGVWFIPLVILSVEGVLFLLERFSKQLFQKIIYVGLAIIVSWSLIVNGKIFFQSMAIYDQKVPLAIIPNSMMGAFEWIRNNTADTDTTLASWYVSGIMPAFTGRPVVGGHGVQTPHEQQVQQAMLDFFSGKAGDYKNFFRSYSVTYVLYSSYEREYGPQDPWNAFVIPLFQEGSVTVYKVR
jgi:hypothetical protein